MLVMHFQETRYIVAKFAVTSRASCEITYADPSIIAGRFAFQFAAVRRYRDRNCGRSEAIPSPTCNSGLLRLYHTGRLAGPTREASMM